MGGMVVMFRLGRAPWWPVISRLGPLRATVLETVSPFGSSGVKSMPGQMSSA